jgi:GTP-binding protein EngB required for normal cell division
LQDARHPDQKADAQFYEYFQDFDLKLGLILNKIDQLKTQKSRAELKKAIPGLSKKYKLARTFFQASAQTKQGMDAIEAAITDFLLNFDSVK